MNPTEARARVWALVAATVDGRRDDIHLLLDDLEPADLANIVHGLACLACHGIDPTIQHGPALLARVRQQLLTLATENGQHGDDD